VRTIVWVRTCRLATSWKYDDSRDLRLLALADVDDPAVLVAELVDTGWSGMVPGAGR